jgi:hypothetical protein
MGKYLEDKELDSVLEAYFNETNNSDANSINFFGKELNIRHVYLSGGTETIIPIDSKIEQVLKIFSTNKGLYNYLYKIHNKLFNEINNDPYFDGKKIKSGNVLIKAIQDNDGKNITDIYFDKIYNVYYICGEYWCDDEHGYSIRFPSGRFVQAKSTDSKDWYKDYVPIATILGQYDNAL